MVLLPRRFRRTSRSIGFCDPRLLLLILLGVPAQAMAQAAHASVGIVDVDQDRAGMRFALAAWPTERGLPGDVLAITQGTEGYLWLGTPGGLVRFDGTRFQPWSQQSGTSELPAWQIHALTSSARGGIWIGFAGGGGVAHMHQGRVTRYRETDGAPPGVNALLEDRQGTIWAATGHGLFRFSDERWSKLTPADGYDGEQAFSIIEDRRGRIWIGSARGLYRYDGQALHTVDAAATQVDSLIEDGAGNIWMTDRTAIVRRLGVADPPHLAPGIRLPLPGYRVLRDHRGGLLVASASGGLFRIAEPASASPRLEPIAVEHRLRGSPRALFQDRDDNVWVGLRGGLLRLSENTFQPVSTLDGLTNDGVRTVAVDGDGSVWVATMHALNRFSGGRRDVYAEPLARAFYRDTQGDMWVSTDRHIARFTGGRWVPAPIPDVPESRVQAMVIDRDRSWLCTAFRGVVSWDGSTLTSHRQPGESGRQCTCMVADRQGRVWAGFTSGGIALHEKGQVRPITERDGLSPGAVVQLLEARDGAIWIATSGGVSRYHQGRVTALTAINAPFSAVTPLLVEDDQGYIWVGVRSGTALIRFAAREMDKVATQRGFQIAYTLFDENDGLQPGTQAWQSGVNGVRDPNGRLWVTTGGGMTIIDPRNLRQVRAPSPPRLDYVTVNGERMAASAVQALPNGATLQIQYAVLNLSAASKLRFRHLLNGMEDDWVYDGEERQASYANMPAGDYRFLVSTTHDGVWTEPAVWNFTVAPPFYLSRWFLIVAGVAVIGGAGVGTWLRERAVKARYALVVAERTRMSREIHDTLLQNLAALGPELEALATRVGPSQEEVATELRRVRRQVGRSVREARDSILELRRHQMGAPRLVDSLAELADATAERHGVRPNVVVLGRRPDRASPEVDMQLYRIAQEAVNNALRHGRATSIDIVLGYEAEQVSLTVKDNGAGFTPRAEATWRHEGEHFGLVTMRERAEKAGGELHVESAPGEGTTVRTVARVNSEWQ
jgi:signal transduction histidine kinase/ligand-binding sensor domain-containing protein